LRIAADTLTTDTLAAPAGMARVRQAYLSLDDDAETVGGGRA
jgi:hypothetical protein